MKMKIFYIIAICIFGIGVSQSAKAKKEEPNEEQNKAQCYTSEGLDAEANGDNNLYKITTPVGDKKLRVKARSMVYNLKDESKESEIEETRLGKIIDVAMSERGNSNFSDFGSGYMFLTIVNKNE